MKSQRQYPRSFSFEFFPPKTDQGKAKLRATRDTLGALGPRYFSVTFGAGGSTQAGTRDTVLEIQQAGFEAAPHISCVGSTRASVQEMLEGYRSAGIRRIVALRGDMPSGMGLGSGGDLRYASELVAFIRETTGDHFHIEVAAYPEFHPQARSAKADLENFKRKIDAGANAGLTQYFYSVDAYLRFIESCEAMGIDAPVVPGIMPITNYTQLARFSDACGAEIPRWLRKRLESFGDDTDSIREYGLEVVSDLCRRLLEQGAPGLHFYTLNQSAPTQAIWERIGLSNG